MEEVVEFVGALSSINCLLCLLSCCMFISDGSFSMDCLCQLLIDSSWLVHVRSRNPGFP